MRHAEKKSLRQDLARAMRERAKDGEDLARVPSDPALRAVWLLATAEAIASREHGLSARASVAAGVKEARKALV